MENQQLMAVGVLKIDRECPLSISVKEIDGKTEVEFKDKNNSPLSNISEHFQKLTGTQNYEMATEIIGHGASAMHAFTTDPDKKLNLSMQNLAEAQPQDAIQARLITQENALYSKGMSYLAAMANTQDLQTAQFFLNGATKLLRLHCETIECYSRYLRKGETKVVVQHVNINDHGKAIVNGIVNG